MKPFATRLSNRVKPEKERLACRMCTNRCGNTLITCKGQIRSEPNVPFRGQLSMREEDDSRYYLGLRHDTGRLAGGPRAAYPIGSGSITKSIYEYVWIYRHRSQL